MLGSFNGIEEMSRNPSSHHPSFPAEKVKDRADKKTYSNKHIVRKRRRSIATWFGFK